MSETDDHINLIQFHRNYGKSAALAEGFKYAEGDYIVTMDADLQDDPAEIPNFVRKLEEGFDLVSGWKKDRKDPISKTVPSKLFNFVTRIFTGVKIHDFNCGLKIYRKAVVKTIDIYGGRHRYIPALAGQKKFKVTEIVVHHRPRLHGVTKYGGARLFHGFFDLISILFLSKYTQSPIYFFGQIGLFTFLIGLGIECYVLYLKYFLEEPFAKHIALLMLGVLIIVIGIQFFSIGLVGEMIANSNQDKESRVKGFLKS
jgi:glycosyltransferase involved in cell wall biosynthesis